MAEKLCDWKREGNNAGAFENLTNAGSNNYSRDAKQERNYYTEYFNSLQGALEWLQELSQELFKIRPQENWSIIKNKITMVLYKRIRQ